MDASVLDGARAYAFLPGKNTQGVVVTRRGVIVAEWYDEGANRNSYGTSWSVAKSFSSAAIGIAIEEGAIAGVDVPLTDYYPAWRGAPQEGIVLEHVLQQATGLEWEESYNPDDIDASDVIQLVLTEDSPLEYVLNKPLESPPNTVFEYSSGNTLLLSGILQQATGMSAGDYAQGNLLQRIGIEGADWWRATTGETLTYCCLDMTSRDFARFGLLYMRGGVWEGEQVVPEAWVSASIAPSKAYAGYGYQWWLIGSENGELPEDTFAALGFDGQFIYVIPSLELVVVRNGHYNKFDGDAVADPTLLARLPPGGFLPDLGSRPPDSWDDVAFLKPILDAVVD